MSNPDTLRAALAELLALEADGKHADECSIEVWERVRALSAPAASAAEVVPAYYGNTAAGDAFRADIIKLWPAQNRVRYTLPLYTAPQPAISPAAPVAEARADGLPASSDERQLRRMLCASHCPQAYMDDGKASDCTASPFIDFMRDSVAVISEKLRARAVSKLAAAPAAAGSAEPASSSGAAVLSDSDIAEAWAEVNGGDEIPDDEFGSARGFVRNIERRIRGTQPTPAGEGGAESGGAR